MRVEIHPRAGDDIVRQFRYYLVDQEALAVAFRFREAAIESIDQLKAHPGIGVPYRGSIAGLRSWPVKGFEAIHIYYKPTDEAIRVIPVLHGKRNVRRILSQE